MPELTLSSDLTPHIFGINNSDGGVVTGFHSIAMVIKKQKPKDSSEKIPIIHKRLYQNEKTGCYFAQWDYSKTEGGKWSDMFPDDLDKNTVIEVIKAAVSYWNQVTDGTSNKVRLQGLCKKYNCSWVGQASINGYIVIIGGKTSNKQVTTAYPLRGANSNY